MTECICKNTSEYTGNNKSSYKDWREIPYK